METLISMTSFVKKVLNEDRPCDRGAILDEIGNYARFLSQPLTLGMFVPCDENGNILREPIAISEFHPSDWGAMSIEHQKYNEAKERVLFEGFEVTKQTSKNQIWISDGTYIFLYSKGKFDMFLNNVPLIENIADRPLMLTETAKKQIGL